MGVCIIFTSQACVEGRPPASEGLGEVWDGGKVRYVPAHLYLIMLGSPNCFSQLIVDTTVLSTITVKREGRRRISCGSFFCIIIIIIRVFSGSLSSALSLPLPLPPLPGVSVVFFETSISVSILQDTKVIHNLLVWPTETVLSPPLLCSLDIHQALFFFSQIRVRHTITT